MFCARDPAAEGSAPRPQGFCGETSGKALLGTSHSQALQKIPETHLPGAAWAVGLMHPGEEAEGRQAGIWGARRGQLAGTQTLRPRKGCRPQAVLGPSRLLPRAGA